MQRSLSALINIINESWNKQMADLTDLIMSEIGDQWSNGSLCLTVLRTGRKKQEDLSWFSGLMTINRTINISRNPVEDCQMYRYTFKPYWSQSFCTGLHATRGRDRILRPLMFCTEVSTSLREVWGQQLLPKCICAKACQPALPPTLRASAWAVGRQ